jgi:hypothetical protein
MQVPLKTDRPMAAHDELAHQVETVLRRPAARCEASALVTENTASIAPAHRPSP